MFSISVPLSQSWKKLKKRNHFSSSVLLVCSVEYWVHLLSLLSTDKFILTSSSRLVQKMFQSQKSWTSSPSFYLVDLSQLNVFFPHSSPSHFWPHRSKKAPPSSCIPAVVFMLRVSTCPALIVPKQNRWFWKTAQWCIIHQRFLIHLCTWNRRPCRCSRSLPFFFSFSQHQPILSVLLLLSSILNPIPSVIILFQYR